MNRLAIRIGFWSALLGACTFVVFTVCFVAIAVLFPPLTWTGLADYAAYVQTHDQFFKTLAQLMMILFGPLLVVLLNSVHECVPAEKKSLTRISLVFGAMFATLSSMHYFVQVTTVRQNIANGQLAGLEHFVQFNPSAAILAMNMVAWTLFFGLASLFVAPVFSGSRLDQVIRLAFLANGFFCLVGGIAFLLGNTWLINLTMNMGMGATVLVAMVALTLFFRRLEREALVMRTG